LCRPIRAREEPERNQRQARDKPEIIQNSTRDEPETDEPFPVAAVCGERYQGFGLASLTVRGDASRTGSQVQSRPRQGAETAPTNTMTAR